MRSVALLAAAAAVAAAAPLPAQVPDFRLGGAAGVAVTTVTGDDDAQSRASLFYGGVLTYHPESSPVGLETGIMVVSKGASRELEGGGRGTLEITYLEAPLLLRVGVSLPGTAVKPVLTAGGSFALRIGCVIEGSEDTTSVSLDCEGLELAQSFDPYFTDVGATAGLNVEFPFRNGAILAPFVRYTRGLRDIARTRVESGVRNSALQLGVSARF